MASLFWFSLFLLPLSGFWPFSFKPPLAPLGGVITEQRKYKLPDSHKRIPKLSVYTVVACSLLNEIHPGYRPLYLREEDQEPMADNILLRMSVENPLLYEEIWPVSFMGAGARDRGDWSM